MHDVLVVTPVPHNCGATTTNERRWPPGAAALEATGASSYHLMGDDGFTVFVHE